MRFNDVKKESKQKSKERYGGTTNGRKNFRDFLEGKRKEKRRKEEEEFRKLRDGADV